MTISEKNWINYINRLFRLTNTAGVKMQEWIDSNGLEDRAAMLEYAHALSTKYGEGSAALACDMYDEITEKEGLTLPNAIPAPTATIEETAKAINGSLKQSPSGRLVASTVSRLVKQPSADTMLHNARRDKAEWAWIPSGDTCIFCITLASRGWQTASDKVMKGNHAEHIHANCDCNFCIRHDSRTNVAGYDPEKYREMYDNAEGRTSQDKINSMRREQYQLNKDEINERKRELYKLNVTENHEIK